MTKTASNSHTCRDINPDKIKDEVNLYRINDTGLFDVFNGSVVALGENRNSFQVYPDSYVRAFASCKEFRTLDDHATEFVRTQRVRELGPHKHSLLRKFIKYASEKLSVSNQEVQDVKRRLVTFVKDGFLVSETELQEKVLQAISDIETYSEYPGSIQFLGIPIRSWGKRLVRCLQSYLDNLEQNHRKCALYIIDDFENFNDDGNTQLRRTVDGFNKRCKAKVQVLWIDKVVRQRLADKISDVGNIPNEVARFALLGDQRYGVRTGSYRNTLMLLAAGELSLQVDDYTLCKVASPPDMDFGLSLSSGPDCIQHRYYKDRNPITERAWIEDFDFLSLHEVLLGKHPGALISDYGKPDIDKMDEKFLKKLKNPQARIAVTFSGSYVDSGIYRHWQRMNLKADPCFKRMVEGSAYMNDVCGSHRLHGPNQMTIGNVPYCINGVIGLDTRQLLPPYIPVQQKEEGIFSLLLHLSFTDSFQGYSPWNILHEPFDRSTNRLSRYSIGPFQTNEIIEAILWSLIHWPFGQNYIRNLQVIGRCLSDLSQRSISYFEAVVREHCWQWIRFKINHLQQILDEKDNGPENWQRDVRHMIDNSRKQMRKEDVCIPCDLPCKVSDRLEMFQELVDNLGQLIIYWPAIWQTAKKIHIEEELLYADIDNYSRSFD